MMDLNPTIDIEMPQDFSNGRMAHLVDRLATLNLGIDHADTVFEEGRQIPTGQVAILVDGCRQHRATVLAIPRRVICPAAEERNSIRSPTDDHGALPEI